MADFVLIGNGGLNIHDKFWACSFVTKRVSESHGVVLKDFLQNSLSEGEEKPGLQPSGALILSLLNLKKVLPLFISGILFSSPFGHNRCWKILVREMAKLMIYKPLQRRSSGAWKSPSCKQDPTPAK